jgi:hypothetical protein
LWFSLLQKFSINASLTAAGERSSKAITSASFL